MHSGGWIALLHQIPKAQYGNLIFTTVAGLEIAAQAVLRIDADYILVRGRQTGVTDGGGFFFIPYERILFMGFQKAVKETVIRSIYGESAGADVEVETTVDTAPPVEEPVAETPATPADPIVAAPTVVTANAAPQESSKPAIANKAALLERLRARRNDPNADAPMP